MNKDGNRRIEAGRLVYYAVSADEQHWETLWEQTVAANFFAPYLQGQLGYFEKAFTRYLPKKGLILEAGCGTGQWVLALQARGYNCLGVDYAVNALQRTNKNYPLPVFGGDLFQLGLANESVEAIISLGVVEHRRAGPEPMLAEMQRVLKPGGNLLISVPYFNPLRLWRAKHGAYQDDFNGLDFYQQAFTKQEFSDILSKAGFKNLETFSYDHRKCLRQELNWITGFGPKLSRIFQKLSDYLPYVNTQLGHMLLISAQKV